MQGAYRRGEDPVVAGRSGGGGRTTASTCRRRCARRRRRHRRANPERTRGSAVACPRPAPPTCCRAPPPRGRRHPLPPVRPSMADLPDYNVSLSKYNDSSRKSKMHACMPRLLLAKTSEPRDQLSTHDSIRIFLIRSSIRILICSIGLLDNGK